MKRTRLLHLFTLLAVILLTLAATSAPAGAATAIATAGMASAAPNDMTQARLRVSQCVYGEPSSDVYLNGAVPVYASVPVVCGNPIHTYSSRVMQLEGAPGSNRG